MRTKRSVIAAVTFMVLILPIFLTNYEAEDDLQSNNEVESIEAPTWFVIEGLVENPLNLTYTELRNFPLISEVTMLECAGSGGGLGWGVTYNWTGVPLFYLLNMANVILGIYREVVFNASDGFSSSVPLETAMDPTTILAFKANGTDLEQIDGFGSGYRVVFPCRWGYKWVKWIKQIIVIDYDYKGTYERRGYSDEAIRPNCTMPLTNPPVQIFNFTEGYSVKALSNSSIESWSFESEGRMVFNVTGSEETGGYFYVKFSEEFLAGPYQVYVDKNPVKYSKTEANGSIYLTFTYIGGTRTIEIAHSYIDVLPSKNVVGQGYNLRIDVSIENPSDMTKTFNITLYTDTTIIGKSTNITLTNGNDTTLTFTWNTTSVAQGDYTVGAYATPALIETDITKSTYIDGTVKIVIPGDVDGDGKVRVDDIFATALAFGLDIGNPRYNPNLDINCDDKIRVDDVLIAALNFGLG